MTKGPEAGALTLFTGAGPSAQTVLMFLAEKHMDIAVQELDVLRREHLNPPYDTMNPGGQIPFLQLGDDFVLAESLAICDYLEELQPKPSLLGETARERAETRMWCRRIDLRIMEPAIQGFKATAGREFFKDRYYLVVSGAKELKALSEKNLAWLDQQLSDQDYICANRFSLADIQLYCFLAFNGGPNPQLDNIQRWYDTVSRRDSSAALSKER